MLVQLAGIANGQGLDRGADAPGRQCLVDALGDRRAQRIHAPTARA
ncbi:MAG: hypothetical protein H7A19_08570 [Rhodanobacteraceae bacterium]|nr:hypothetical protein [Rhodanobacteraceae bacterium]